MATSNYRVLYDRAEDQMGYVTTAQAGGVGISPMALVMMARRGRIERVSRGVYRLIDFPVQPLSQYMQATLWPHGHRGVISHETALSLLHLSDVDPDKIHITLPVGFRIQREIPDYLVVHRGIFLPEDVMQFEGMPITTPMRTISDCIDADLGPSLIVDAIDQARSGGMVSEVAAAVLHENLRRASHEARSR